MPGEREVPFFRGRSDAESGGDLLTLAARQGRSARGTERGSVFLLRVKQTSSVVREGNQ